VVFKTGLSGDRLEISLAASRRIERNAAEIHGRRVGVEKVLTRKTPGKSRMTLPVKRAIFSRTATEVPMKKILVFAVGLLATLYILNPTAGVFEILPDNLPIVGNLDEAAAVVLLLMCLKYFGIDLPNLFRRGSVDDKTIEVDPK
jgi:hypothetical protein